MRHNKVWKMCRRRKPDKEEKKRERNELEVLTKHTKERKRTGFHGISFFRSISNTEWTEELYVSLLQEKDEQGRDFKFDPKFLIHGCFLKGRKRKKVCHNNKTQSLPVSLSVYMYSASLPNFDPFHILCFSMWCRHKKMMWKEKNKETILYQTKKWWWWWWWWEWWGSKTASNCFVFEKASKCLPNSGKSFSLCIIIIRTTGIKGGESSNESPSLSINYNKVYLLLSLSSLILVPYPCPASSSSFRRNYKRIAKILYENAVQWYDLHHLSLGNTLYTQDYELMMMKILSSKSSLPY